MDSGRDARGSPSLIYTVIMLAFWAVALPFAALVCFPWTFLTGDIAFLYRTGMWAAWTGVRLAGVKVETVRSRENRSRSGLISYVEPCVEH